jgi:hypothetical protein
MLVGVVAGVKMLNKSIIRSEMASSCGDTAGETELAKRRQRRSQPLLEERGCHARKIGRKSGAGDGGLVGYW